MTINIITLGSSKNNPDSEILAAQFRQQGNVVYHNSIQEKGIDTVVVNTCSFIQDAKEQAINEILCQIERNKAGEIKKVYVIGCLAQRYEADFQASLPDLDGIFP